MLDACESFHRMYEPSACAAATVQERNLKSSIHFFFHNSSSRNGQDTRSCFSNHTEVSVLAPPPLPFQRSFCVELGFLSAAFPFLQRLREKPTGDVFLPVGPLVLWFCHHSIHFGFLFRHRVWPDECPVMPASLFNTLLASAFQHLSASGVALSKQKEAKWLDKCTRTRTHTRMTNVKISSWIGRGNVRVWCSLSEQQYQRSEGRNPLTQSSKGSKTERDAHQRV